MFRSNATGHEQNVTYLKTLIAYCKGFGLAYNPGNQNITTNALSLAESEAKSTIDFMDTSEAQRDHLANLRAIAFKGLPKILSGAVNNLESFGVPEEKVKDARSLIHVITSRKKKDKEPEVVNPELTPGVEPEKKSQYTRSRRSYDTQLEVFGKLIKLLSTEPSYFPNESRYTIIGLTNLLYELETLNDSVKQSEVTLDTVRTERNRLLYSAANNIYKLSLIVKKYVKSVFGSKSDQYRQVAALRFVNRPSMG